MTNSIDAVAPHYFLRQSNARPKTHHDRRRQDVDVAVGTLQSH
jgi:hypothetical protein